MAEIKTDRQGRKYILLAHHNHEHRVYFDSDLDEFGSGMTSNYSERAVRTRLDEEPLDISMISHQHSIIDWEVRGATLPDARLNHEHRDISASDLANIYTETTAMRITDFPAPPTITFQEGQSREAFGFLEAAVRTPAITRENILATRSPANSIDTSIVEVDWHLRDKTEPFYSINRKEYCITIEMCDEYTPSTENPNPECERYIIQAIAQGVLGLAEFYHKKVPPSEPEQMDLINSAEMEQYLDSRPKSKIKLLVKLPASIFERLENEISADAKVGLNISHSVMYNSSLLRGQISAVSEKLIELQGEAQAQNIGMPGTDLLGESTRLQKFFSKLSKLFLNNGVILREDHEDTIEVGFHEKYKVAYVLYNNVSMDIGFNSFVNSDPANNVRTVAYFSKISEMDREIKSNRGVVLTEFILKYTYPRPSLQPSNENTNPKASVGNNTSSSIQLGDNTAKSMEPALASELYVTDAQRSREDSMIRNPEFIRQVANEADSIVNFVGDSLVTSLPELIGRVDSIEEFFSVILNKIDIDSLTNLAVTAALGQVPTVKDMLSGATETFFEKIEDTNKNIVNSIKQGIQLVSDQTNQVNEVFALMSSFSDFYRTYATSQIPQLSGDQVYPLRFASVFGEYMINPNFHSPHPVDAMIDIIQEESGLNVVRLGTMVNSLTRSSGDLEQFDANLRRYLNTERENTNNILNEADLNSLDFGSLSASLVDLFSRIVEYYTSQVGILFVNVVENVERTIDQLVAIPEQVASFIADLPQKTAAKVQESISRGRTFVEEAIEWVENAPDRYDAMLNAIIADIENRVDRLLTLADEMIQAVRDFPDIFTNMVDSKITEIETLMDSKIGEIEALRDSSLSQISNMISEITDGISNIENFVDGYQTSSVDEVFQQPKKPSVTTLPSLPDNLPTFDIMSFLVEKAETSIINTIESSILEVAKSALGSAVESITSGVTDATVAPSLDYGNININSTLSEGLAVGSPAAPGNTNALNNMTGQLASGFGNGLSTGTTMSSLGSRTSSLLDDVSSVLTTNETTSLLEGNPSPNTVRSVSNIVNSSEYADLTEVFGSPGSSVTEAKIVDFFRFLGQQVGPGVLNSARQQARPVQTGMTRTDEERQLLTARYGDSMTTEEIEVETRKKDRKSKKKAFKLMQNSSKSPSSKKNKTPAVIGGPDALFPKNPPSVDYMVDRTIETTFESISMFFNQALHGIGGFVDALSYRSGTRLAYEERRKSDQRNKDVRPVLIAAAIANLIPPPLPYGTGDPRTNSFSEETSYYELLNSPLSEVREKLKDPIITSPQGVFNFSMPGTNSFVWKFLRSQGALTYDHVISFPAPDQPPYPAESFVNIVSNQLIDPDSYAGTVPEILDEIEADDSVQDVFTNLALHDLKKDIPNLETDAFEEYLNNVAYHRIMKDLIQMFTNEILKSDVFTATMVPYVSLSNNAKVPTAIPNWRLEPPSDILGQTQTTLLGLEDLRVETKKRYTESAMKEGEAISDSMQKAMVASVVTLIIRIHITEIMLRTLPVFDRFQKSDFLGDDYIKYIKLKIKETCVRQDPYYPGYYQNVLQESRVLYEEDWISSNKALIDPFTNLELPAPSVAKPEQCLDFLVKKTMLGMSDQFRNLEMISSAQPKTLKKMLLENWLKASHKQSGMFDPPQPHTGGEDVYIERFEELLDEEWKIKRELREEDRSGTPSKNIKALQTFADGGLLLERYIQYVGRERGDFGYIEGSEITKIISLDEVEALSEEEKSDAKEIKHGLRLIFLPDLGELRRDVSNLEPDASPFQMILFDDIEESFVESDDDWRTATEQARAYRIKERFASKILDEGINPVLKDDDTLKTVYIDRVTYPLPLASVMIDIGDNWPQEMPAYPKRRLINKMSRNPRFNLLFEQCFPLQKILSVMTIYTEVLFSTVAGGLRLNTAFDQTKNAIKSIFDSVINMNDYTYRDRGAESVGGNSGLQSGYAQLGPETSAVFTRPKKTFPEGRARVGYKNPPPVEEKSDSPLEAITDAAEIRRLAAGGEILDPMQMKQRFSTSADMSEGVFTHETQLCPDEADREDDHDREGELSGDSPPRSRAVDLSPSTDEEISPSTDEEIETCPEDISMDPGLLGFTDLAEMNQFLEDYYGGAWFENFGFSTWQEALEDRDVWCILMDEVDFEFEFADPADPSEETYDGWTIDQLILWMQDQGRGPEEFSASSWDDLISDSGVWEMIAYEISQEPPLSESAEEEPEVEIITSATESGRATGTIVQVMIRGNAVKMILRGAGLNSGVPQGLTGRTDLGGEEFTITRITGPDLCEVESVAPDGMTSSVYLSRVSINSSVEFEW